MTGREPSPFQPHRTLQRMYPEVAAGGYTRHDGFVEKVDGMTVFAQKKP